MIGLLGASGYIGQSFVNELVEQKIHFLELTRERDDYYNFEKLITIICDNDIKAIINCAGYTGKPNVDVCEENKEVCYAANVTLPKTIATACVMTGAKLLHISSGCIYSGDNNGSGFTEEDEPNFDGSYYSFTKLTAEKMVSSICNDVIHYICRLRMPFDEYDSPRNLLSKYQRYDKLLKATNSITHRKEFTQACIHLLTQECPSGIYNIINKYPITTEQVVGEINNIFDINRDYTFFTGSEEFMRVGAKAPRSNCVLDGSKLESTGFKMRESVPAIQDSLRKWVKE